LRKLTIGKHGSPWTPETARAEAKRLLAEVAAGRDPAMAREADRKAPTFDELIDLYLAEGVGHKKPSTLKADRGRIEHHLRPLLGKLRADRIARADVERMRNAVTAGKTAQKIEDGEERPLTGCRRGEIVNLRWEHVDFERECLRLPDSKTGAKVVYLNAPARALLQDLPWMAGNPRVIPGMRVESASAAIDNVWPSVRKTAGLSDVRLHDLRHSFASVGAAGGLSLPIIGALLGHKHATTTARYAHLSADPLRAANDAVGARIAAAMNRKPGAEASAEVVKLPPRTGDASRCACLRGTAPDTI
jgi:integrase